MNVPFGSACLTLLISCWCLALTVSTASNGVRPRRQSRTATLNEFLTPPAPPNAHHPRNPGFFRNQRNQQHQGGPQPLPLLQGPSPATFRHGKILSPPTTEAPGYFAKLMGWLNPFGSLTSQWTAPPQQSTVRQQSYNPGHYQSSPGANGHGLPAPSYGSPTNSYEGHLSGEKLPRPPAPKGGPAYLPPTKSRNCNPCNQVPWTPLYQGVKTEDTRYAAASISVAPSLETTFNRQQDNAGTNVYHASTFSQEVKVPDFHYGPPSLPVLDVNNRVSSPASSFDFNSHEDKTHNDNFDHAQVENRFPLAFTGPIPNPHLYPGAIPPLFKATPFHPISQVTETPLDPQKPVDYSQPDASFFGGFENGNPNGASPGDASFVPSSHIHVPLPGPQDYRSDKQPSGKGVLDPPSDLRSEQQQLHNIETPLAFNAPIDHQQSSSHRAEALIGEGYVDELPPGAEVVPSGPDDHFQSSFHGNQANHADTNLDHQGNSYSSTKYETQSATSAASFGTANPAGQKDFRAVGTDLENYHQSTSYGSHLSSDGQHVIHIEQSPVIDLSSINDEEGPKNSNDSSIASSTSTRAFENPPVVLQNPDGTYGINTTWPTESSVLGRPLSWSEEESSAIAVPTSSSSKEFPSESHSSATLQNFEYSSTDLPVTAASIEEKRSDFTKLSRHSLRNNSDQQNERSQLSENEERTEQRNYKPGKTEISEVPRQASEERFVIPEALRKRGQDLLKLYPGLIKFENTESYGFKLPDVPAKLASDEPFLRALMKSYNNLRKEAGRSSDQGSMKTGNRENWFDPRQYLSGAGFKPSRDLTHHEQKPDEGKFKSENRQHGTKKNKQVQIIIPYTSQYTPKPFHPLTDERSGQRTPTKTQARKMPMYDGSRDYLSQETRKIENEVTQILQPLKNFSRMVQIMRPLDGPKTNTSIDVLRLQKNIDNWTIQEYSTGTTASTEAPRFSRPYLSPSKNIPNEYLTTTQPVDSSKNTIEETEQEISHVLAGFSFNDLEHEAAASDHVDVSRVQVSPHLNELSSVFPEVVEATTLTSVPASTIPRDTWKELPVSISPLNKERVYVVTPQSVATLSTTKRGKSYDKPVSNGTTKASMKESDLDNFESIERAYQVLPQAVNNLVVASTGPATIPLWGIMEHEEYASNFNDTTPDVPILYAGHSKVSHTRQ